MKSYFECHCLAGESVLQDLGIEDEKDIYPMTISLADIKYFFGYAKEVNGTWYDGVAVQYHSSLADTQIFAICRYEDFRQAYRDFMQSLQAFDITLEQESK